MRIHKSAEDYLEMILRLNEEKGYARSVDIATGALLLLFIVIQRAVVSYTGRRKK